MQLSNIFGALKVACLGYVLAVGAVKTSNASDIQDLGVVIPVSGAVGDMANQTYAQGMAFQVNFRNIDYQGQVSRLLVERKASDKLTVWVGLRNLTVTIHNTTISGRRHHATCGPLQVVLGSQNEAWLAFHVTQNSQDVRLNPEQTRFGFKQNNWTIGSPSWVQVSGFGMTQSKVVAGLRGGLADQRSVFEQRIIEVAPTIFESVAKHVRNHLHQELLAAN